MDRFSYSYIPSTNKLTHVTDEVAPDLFQDDIDNQPANNYQYDQIGQLISDASERIENITWRVDGKVKSIQKNGSEFFINFFYDGLGNRVAKQVSKGRRGTKTSHYTRDAQGNTMAVYDLSLNPENRPEYNLKEHHIYGSSRLGLQEYEYEVSTFPAAYNFPENHEAATAQLFVRQLSLQELEAITVNLPENHQAATAQSSVRQLSLQELEARRKLKDYFRLVGDKRYELSNHLGNVLSVISDRKIVQKNMKLHHLDTFNEELYWGTLNGFGKSYINKQRELQVVIEPLNLCGTTLKLKFEENQTVMFNFDIKRLSSFPTCIPINLEIRDPNDKNVIWSSIISSDGIASGSFTPTVTAEYLVTLSAFNTKEEAIEFTIDNFYAYVAPPSPTDFVSLFLPDVLAYNDYYPFGMLVPNRHSVDDYRYGFQGQEKDDEIKGGKGNSLNYTFRMHDPRVGRFFATDPLAISYPFYSPYAFSGNRVIDAVELEGKEPEIYVTKIETGHTLVRVYGAGNITQKAVKHI